MDFDNITNSLLNVESKNLKMSSLDISPFAFANEVLYWCQVYAFKDITNLKLQKLLYYCYAITSWQLINPPFDPIIKNDNKEKYILDFFPLGPVVVPVYEGFKHYGESVIAKNLEEYKKAFFKKEADDSEDPKFVKYEISDNLNEKEDIANAIRYTLVALGDITAPQLVNMTHTPRNSAWYAFYHNQNKKTDKAILSKMYDEIKYYGFFEDLYNKKKDNY